MPRRTLTATALTLLWLLPAALLWADDPPKGDKDLDGEWEVTSVIRDGKELPTPPAPLGRDHAIFQGDTMTSKIAAGDSHKVSIKLDTTKTPHTIDVIVPEGPDKGKALLGIYEVKGDELRMCIADPDKERPTSLSAKEGSSCGLTTLKRVKK